MMFLLVPSFSSRGGFEPSSRPPAAAGLVTFVSAFRLRHKSRSATWTRRAPRLPPPPAPDRRRHTVRILRCIPPAYSAELQHPHAAGSALRRTPVCTGTEIRRHVVRRPCRAGAAKGWSRRAGCLGPCGLPGCTSRQSAPLGPACHRLVGFSSHKTLGSPPAAPSCPRAFSSAACALDGPHLDVRARLCCGIGRSATDASISTSGELLPSASKQAS
jgi:hypothetical protein